MALQFDDENRCSLKPFKDEEQTALFEGPVRTAL
jgi:hypothetical protein